MSLISVRGLHLSYSRNAVLKGVSFSAEQGQFISILGPNGAGKSTLFRGMLGILKPEHGDVLLEGTSVFTLNPAQRAKQMAYIPQSHNPVFNFSVADLVLMGTTAQTCRFAVPGKKQMELVDRALKRLGIRHLKGRSYMSLSGGERQLVLIARAVSQQARILIMDEPSASLDFGNCLCVMDMVKGLAQDGYTIIQSTHDPEQAYYYSDRILALKDGAVLAWGTPDKIIQPSILSQLYDKQIEVCSLRNGAVRVCIPYMKHERMIQDV